MESQIMYRTKAEKALALSPINSLFKKYAIPGVIGLLFLGIQTIIDGIIVGNFLGANALASVNLILPCYSLLAAVAMVISIGSQTIVSISFGKQQYSQAANAMKTAWVFLLLFAILTGLLIYLCAPSLVRFLGANDVLAPYAIDYLRSLAPFAPAITLMFWGDYMLKATGHPTFSMIAMCTAIGLNIILSITFITYCGWGISGAGWATGISAIVSSGMSFFIILRNKHIVSLFSGRFKGRLLLDMSYNGSSEGLTELSKGVTIFLFNTTLMQHVGEAGVAAFTIIEYIFFVGITLFIGVSDGIIPILSYNCGAKKYDRIRKTLILAAKVNITTGIGFFILLITCGGNIISLFLNDGQEAVQNIAENGAKLYAFAFLMNGLNILASAYFTAIANAKISLIISGLRGLLFVSVNILLLPHILGIDGIWISVPLAELSTLAVSMYLVWRSLKNAERKNRVFHAEKLSKSCVIEK